jgi:hypothetical protein
MSEFAFQSLQCYPESFALAFMALPDFWNEWSCRATFAQNLPQSIKIEIAITDLQAFTI